LESVAVVLAVAVTQQQDLSVVTAGFTQLLQLVEVLVLSHFHLQELVLVVLVVELVVVLLVVQMVEQERLTKV
jgi:hypothetical protein